MLLLTASSLTAQTTQWQNIHEVKKKETIFGIAQSYGISMDELMAANPHLLEPGAQLKKGEKLFIPFATKVVVSSSQEPIGTSTRPIRLGVMLPLHDSNGDGRRMVEYYRGVLLACDSVKRLGISVDVHAWNVTDDGDDIYKALTDPAAATLDIILGPLYSRHMQVLSDFVARHGIMLITPFSINAPQLRVNPNIFQVYQTPSEIEDVTVRRACSWFKDYHPVIVDCADAESNMGTFTAALRKGFEQRGIAYSLTSLASSNSNFAAAFDTKKRNLVIINSPRLNSLEAAISKLGVVSSTKPAAPITMLGYSDWLLHAGKLGDYFHTFDVYIPTVYYANAQSAETLRLKKRYRSDFHQDMQPVQPQFALTGFDHAYFFLRGLKKYGKAFDGAEGRFGYEPVQTPLKFARVGNGGRKNHGYMFVHYKTDRKVEKINY